MKYGNTRSKFMMALAALIWGVAFVAQSVGMDYVGPYTFNASRFLIGGFVLIPCIMLLKRRRKENLNAEQSIYDETKGRKYGLIGGICCGTALFVGSTLQQIGIAYTSVGKAGFITALYIVIVPILGIFMKKKVSVKVWISVLIATCGMYLLCITENFSIGKGDFLIFLCAIGFSFHILIIDYFSPKADGMVISCVQFFTAAVESAVVMFLTEQPLITSICAAWLPILYAGVMSCGVAYTLQVVAQKDVEPAIASLILSLESVFSMLAGWIILKQVLSVKELFGCALVFAAIILTQLPDQRKWQKNNG